MIPATQFHPFVAPAGVSIPEVTASITPQASKSWSHVAGSAKGGTLVYVDLNAFTWWVGSGWVTYNTRGYGLRYALRGVEDEQRRRG